MSTNEDKNQKALANLQLAKPCTQNWDEMVGDERERFCHQCSLNVYNISSMTKNEAEEFLQLRNDGSVCLNYTEKADGTIVTDDCPRPIRPLRDPIFNTLRKVGSFAAAFGLFVSGALAQGPQRLAGKPCVPVKDEKKELEQRPLLGSPPVLSKTEQEELNTQSTLRNKIEDLKKKNKLNSKLGAQSILDLGNFYKGKRRYTEAIPEYDKAIEILKKLPKEKELLKNAELNKAAAKKEMEPPKSDTQQGK